MQKRHISSALAMELHLFSIKSLLSFNCSFFPLFVIEINNQNMHVLFFTTNAGLAFRLLHGSRRYVGDPNISGSRFNIKMPSYQYRKSHCGDKTVAISSYLHNGVSYTGKTTSLYWIRAQVKHFPLEAVCILFTIKCVLYVVKDASITQ